MREGGLEGIETVVQRQERVAPERDDDGLLGREYRRARLLRAGALVLDRGALLPFGHRLRVDAVTLGQHPQARLTMLDRSTHRLCRAGAPMENLAHSASFHSREKGAPPNHGTKHLVATLAQDLPAAANQIISYLSCRLKAPLSLGPVVIWGFWPAANSDSEVA